MKNMKSLCPLLVIAVLSFFTLCGCSAISTTAPAPQKMVPVRIMVANGTGYKLEIQESRQHDLSWELFPGESLTITNLGYYKFPISLEIRAKRGYPSGFVIHSGGHILVGQTVKYRKKIGSCQKIVTGDLSRVEITKADFNSAR